MPQWLPGVLGSRQCERATCWVLEHRALVAATISSYVHRQVTPHCSEKRVLRTLSLSPIVGDSHHTSLGSITLGDHSTRASVSTSGKAAPRLTGGIGEGLLHVPSWPVPGPQGLQQAGTQVYSFCRNTRNRRPGASALQPRRTMSTQEVEGASTSEFSPQRAHDGQG